MPFVQTETKAGMKVSNLYISQIGNCETHDVRL